MPEFKLCPPRMIERNYLLLYIIAQMLAIAAPAIASGIQHYYLVSSDAHDLRLVYDRVNAVVKVFTGFPIMLICGLWLRKRARDCGESGGLWFWAGVVLGIEALIVSLIVHSFGKSRTEPAQEVEK